MSKPTIYAQPGALMTRSEYMEASREDGHAAHRAYFGQFVTESTISRVVAAIGADTLRASTDPHMNDIPLSRWDRLVPQLPGSAGFRKAGDYYTTSHGVCLAKEAARQWLDRQQVAA